MLDAYYVWVIIAIVCLILEIFNGTGIMIGFAIPAGLTALVIKLFAVTPVGALLVFVCASSVTVPLLLLAFKELVSKKPDINDTK